MYLFRRGQGLSADQGPFMQDILQHEETTKGKEARQHLQFVMASTDHLDDVMAGLSLLEATPVIDRQAHCDRRSLVRRSIDAARRGTG